MSSNTRRIDEWWIGEDVEGNDCGPIWGNVISMNLPGVTEEYAGVGADTSAREVPNT
jgi:hypothetical protein